MFYIIVVVKKFAFRKLRWEQKMNEIAQWSAIAVMFLGLCWLYFCIYSDR